MHASLKMRFERFSLCGNFFELLRVDERLDARRCKTRDGRAQHLGETTGGNADTLRVTSEPACSGHARLPPPNDARALRLPDDSVGRLGEIMPKLLECHVIDSRMPHSQIQTMYWNRLPGRMIRPESTLLATRRLGSRSSGLRELILGGHGDERPEATPRTKD